MKRNVLKGLFFLFFCTAVCYSYGSAGKEKPIVVVTCMYNNEQWVLNNLAMIFAQEYTRFRVIIVDDGSTDKTACLIEQYIQEHALASRVTFIKNETRKRKLANLYRVLYMVDDEEIVILIDGDDWLADTRVFPLINALYEEDVWFTYGQYKNVPTQEAIAWGFNPKGYARPIPKAVYTSGTYRKGPFYYMHLRTFRGWLFKMVKLEDLLCTHVEGFKGTFFPASNDLAMYYPMVEMATHRHIAFVPKVIYIRNLYSPLVGFKVDSSIQLKAAHEVKHKRVYEPLEKAVYRNLKEEAKKAISIICAIDAKTDIAALSKNIYTWESEKQKGDSIGIFCVSSLLDNKKQMVQKKFSHIRQVQCTSLCEALERHSDKFSTEYCYVVCTHKGKLPKRSELRNAVYELKRTYASAVFFVNNTKVIDPEQMPLAAIEHQLFACKWGLYPMVGIPETMIDGILIAKTTLMRWVSYTRSLLDYTFFSEQQSDQIVLLYQKIKEDASVSKRC